ncbi:tetratricopeptide repeat protein [Streptomyces sp. 5-8]|uniref:Tetratricopeptide repeat protein n=1 Tax=Streptomyces musisoli TaxID=2802280 RepID=A0ABS1P0I3_9ACTN|nr:MULTISPECIES: tetratricopeptide repeat protein [Streptomyces]MBL1105871.1 tetratricopeptide repeat protein [Streptomyces musisoli]MBY8841759.1 tetratricopeptide repeat protein [Streptomyces sp. SP2-10]
MKRKVLLVALTGAAAVATGVTTWAIESHSAATSESSESKAPAETRDADWYLQRGILQEKYQDPPAAAKSYSRVLELEPRNKFAWYNLGHLAHQAGRTADARAAYEEALKTDPAFPPALFNEAVLLESSDPEKAVTLLERAVVADPKAATAHLHLGRIWARQDRDRKATDEFRRTVAIDPSLLSQVPEEFRDSADPSSTSSEAGSDS